jgi:hypothetical protein
MEVQKQNRLYEMTAEEEQQFDSNFRPKGALPFLFCWSSWASSSGTASILSWPHASKKTYSYVSIFNVGQSRKKSFGITGALLALFILTVLFARGKYSDAPECLPYDKAYETPKVVQLDEKPTRCMPWRRCGSFSHPKFTFR